MRQHFHPLDHSSRAQYARAHDDLIDRYTAVDEMMRSTTNPLSREELHRLAVIKPERWGVFRLRGDRLW